MGMDVFGVNPKSQKGEYFRNNVWWWRPLWNYCVTVAPVVCCKVTGAQFNDGDGLGDEDSLLLAKALKAEIESGRTAEYARGYKQWQASLPSRGKCNPCGGSGIHEKSKCPWCDGAGLAPAWEAEYPFAVDNVKGFAEFLQYCGGFQIC